MTAELTLTNLRRTLIRIMAKGTSQKLSNGSALNFEAQLWAAADKMRFWADLHPDLKTDFVPVRKDLANPPFNMSDWSRSGGMRQDVRWKFGMPPVNNANYAWIQHFIHHLSPVGVAGFVLANGSMSTQTSNEGDRDEKCTPITESDTAPENCVTLCLNQ